MGILNGRRNEVLRMIIDTFDVTDTLERERDVLEARLMALQRNTPEAILKLSEMDNRVLKVGREVLVEKVLRYWRDVSYEVDEDTDEVKSMTPFEKWRDEVVDRSKIPTWCSVDGFYDYFDVELRTIYDAECEKALARAHGDRG